jgi:3-deoxy-D-manno-octulosonate 8-phosphate phosphatase (KDO 8-P phosphatase)
MSLLDDFKKIRCFGFDVDGVLTDGSVLLLDDGQMARTMNTKDGYAMQLAVKRGYTILVISGGGAEGARLRLQKLGITAIYFQATNKKALLEAYLEEHHILPEEVLFMGDDIPDLDAMKLCGIPCCPADAVGEVKNLSRYIAALPGGKGCVREVIEKVLKLNGHWGNDTSVPSK